MKYFPKNTITFNFTKKTFLNVIIIYLFTYYVRIIINYLKIFKQKI